MTYIVGEKLDLTGGIMTVTFPYAYGEESETTSVDVVMTSEYVTTSADEITKTGTNRIKIN